MLRMTSFFLFICLLFSLTLSAQVQQCACVENIPEIDIWDGASCNSPVSMRSGYSDNWQCNSEPFNLEWDFGDGTTAPASSFNDVVNHVYSTDGTYEVNFSYQIIDANGVLCTQYHLPGSVEIQGCANECQECELDGDIELLSLVNDCVGQFYLGGLSLDPNCAWFDGEFDWYVNGEYYGSSGPFPDVNYAINLYDLSGQSYVQVTFSAACNDGGFQDYSLATYVEHPDCNCNCFEGVDYTLHETSGSNGVGCQQSFFFDPWGFDSSCGEIIDTDWYVDGTVVLTTQGQGYNNAILDFDSDGDHTVLAIVNYLCYASNSMPNYYFVLDDTNSNIDIEGCTCDCTSDIDFGAVVPGNPCDYIFGLQWNLDESCGQLVDNEYHWFMDGSPMGTTSSSDMFPPTQFTLLEHEFAEDGTHSVDVEFDILCDDGTITTHSLNQIVDVDGCNSDPEGECDCISDIVFEYIGPDHPEGSGEPCLSYATIDFTFDESCGELDDHFIWKLNGEVIQESGFSSAFLTQAWGLYHFTEDGVYTISVDFDIRCDNGAITSYSASEFIGVYDCGPPQGTGSTDGSDSGNQIPGTDGGIASSGSGTDSGSTSGQTSGSASGIISFDSTGTDGGQTDGGQTSGGQTSGGQTSGGQTSGGQTSGGLTDGGHTGRGDVWGADGGNQKVDLSSSFAPRNFTVYPSILSQGEFVSISSSLKQATNVNLVWRNIHGQVLQSNEAWIGAGNTLTSSFNPSFVGAYLLTIEGGNDMQETIRVIFY